MRGKIPTAAVLMSTYNGERFLAEQIQSVLDQEGIAVELYIRDDGSRDGTIEIVRRFAARHPNVHLTAGKNVGVGLSFLDLLYSTPGDYDYYAFCDQDDIWLPRKLAAAVRVLTETGNGLYGSNQTLVDAGGKPLGPRYSESVDISLARALQKNKVAGCTMVFTNRFRNLMVEEARRPDETFMKSRLHDVWFAMAGALLNTFVYDERSFILYRQHENNVVGAYEEGPLAKLKKKVRKLKSPEQLRTRSLKARELKRCFPEHPSALLDICSDYRGPVKKWRLLRAYDAFFREDCGRLEFYAYVLLGLF